MPEEFKTSDPDLKLTVSEETDCSESAISAKDSARVIALIEALPNGIIRMSREIDKLVETSLNLGSFKIRRCCCYFKIRSQKLCRCG